jgi:hypothetical protein
MTGEEKMQAEDMVLARYEHLSITVAADERALCRLLRGLKLSATSDKDVVAYLCSCLTA